MTRVVARRVNDSFLWESEHDQGNGFIVNGSVTLHAEDGKSWLDVEGDLLFIERALLERAAPVDTSDMALALEPRSDWPWMLAEAHLLPWTVIDRLKRGHTIMVPSRSLLRESAAAACVYTRDACTVSATATMTGIVRGKSIQSPSSLRAVTCWVEV